MVTVAFLYAFPLLILAFITGDTRISPDKETPDMRNVGWGPNYVHVWYIHIYILHTYRVPVYALNKCISIIMQVCRLYHTNIHNVCLSICGIISLFMYGARVARLMHIQKIVGLFYVLFIFRPPLVAFPFHKEWAIKARSCSLHSDVPPIHLLDLQSLNLV